MKTSPLLSIVVPVYNVAPYLRGCLDSILGQTLRDIEIICVDDGSTDGSGEILREYATKDDRIIFISKKNGGQSSARNEGLKKAQAEFVTFVDSDDYVEPDAYEKALRFMEADIDYVCFGIQTFGCASEEVRKSDENYYSIKFNGKVKVTTEVIESTDVSPCNKIFRKSFLEKYEIDFPEGLKYEDAYFYNIYALRSQYAFYIKDKMYHYIRRRESTMGSTFAGVASYNLDHLKIGICIYRYLKKHAMLERCLHYFGKLYFSLTQCAVRYAGDDEIAADILNYSDSLLKDENIDFSAYPDLTYTRLLVKNRIRPGEIRKKCLGLIRIKYKYSCIKYYFCGIPVRVLKFNK